MSIPRVLTFLLFASCIASGTVSGESRQAQMKRELAHLRESLHEAQVELARKADRIVELEAALEELEPGTPASNRILKKRIAVLSEELHKARRTIRDLEKHQKEIEKAREREKKDAENARASAKKGRSITECSSTECSSTECSSTECSSTECSSTEGSVGLARDSSISFLIRYEKRSAVNYEGRESALEFMQKRTSENSNARFRVEAGADDSDYRTVDKTIAENRANYLLAFLRTNGIPGDVFTEVVTSSTRDSDGERKFVKITEIADL
ncbi:MAG: hypothetical protein AAGC68_04120 [Verrucomicrobiota bacterium]